MTSTKGRSSVAKLRKMKLYNPNIDLINDMCIQNVVQFCPLVLKILSGNEILTSTKGYNSVANMQKIVLYNPILDVINVNVYTNFG